MKPSQLQVELKQGKPFRSLEEEATLSVARTYALLARRMADALKPFGITPTQYNVLRILAGAGRDGLCRFEIKDRLITAVPDVTRLLDRMEEAGYIERERDRDDRRHVSTRITASGTRTLDATAAAVAAAHRAALGHLGEPRLRSLIRTLALARRPPAADRPRPRPRSATGSR